MLIKKILLIVGIASILEPALAWSQEVQLGAASESKPLLLAAAKAAPVKGLTPVAPDEPPLAPGLEHLKGIVVLGSTNDFKVEGYPGASGIMIKGPAFLQQHQALVTKTLSPYLGKPLTATAMTNLQIELILVCRQLDRPVVDVFFPGNRQEIVDSVQIMVYEGKLDHVAVKHEGKAWFSDRMLTNHIHLKPGDSILQSKLLQDVFRLNLNPQFREVNVVYEPGDPDPDGHGTTTVDLDVKERFPFRVYGGADDYGLKILGENQAFGGFNYGNLFGADQQLNYQYTTDFSFDRLQQHSASYLIPLPWFGNSFTIYGNYNRVQPDLSEIGFGPIKYNDGRTYQLSARYTIPLPVMCGIGQDISVGYDFKSANTPATFGKVVVNPYRADIDQAALDYHAYEKDRLGYTQVFGSGYYSPGGLLGKNSSSNFATFGPANLKSDYYYGRVEGDRAFNLPWGFQLRGRAGWQDASTGLLPSEQLYLGGNALLRGYPESVESGDEGWYGSAELHLPIISTGNLTRQHNVPNVNGDTLDAFVFFDYGSVKSISPNQGPLEGNPYGRVNLESVGGGLVYSVSQNLKISFSYGHQLKELPSDTPAPLTREKGKFHLSATLSF
jgi:hemolysin activation/secretion protein